MIPLRPRQPFLAEDLKDYKYSSHQDIILPASKVLIGTGGKLDDAKLYEADDLTWSFSNGVGLLGLDTGAEAEQQWYCLYAVPNGDSLSLVASTNRPPQSGFENGPVGYDRFRYLGLFRNGTNPWETTNNSYGRGDIVRFAKLGQLLKFQSFNTSNGGIYPINNFFGFGGVNLYIANTATNAVNFDANTNIAMSGNNHLPYLDCFYKFSMAANSGNNAYLRLIDGSTNNRQAFPAIVPVPSTTVRIAFTDWINFSIDNGWASRLQHNVDGNPNVSRGLYVDQIIDPFV